MISFDLGNLLPPASEEADLDIDEFTISVVAQVLDYCVDYEENLLDEVLINCDLPSSVVMSVRDLCRIEMR